MRLLASPAGGPRALAYGNCSTGCGRPSGSDGCRICLPGSYGTGEGVCRLCVAGKYGNASISRASSATEACIKCDQGKFVAAYGAAVCAACPIGHVCTDAHVLAADLTLQPVPPTGAIPLPTPCPRGTYNPSEGAASPAACLLCAEGRYRNESGGTVASSCLPCLPGYFASTAGAFLCDACAPSTYQPAAASARCEQCPAGYFSSSEAATACEGCREGTFGQADAAGSRCVDCPMGTYNPINTSTECLPCPVNTLGATLGWRRKPRRVRPLPRGLLQPGGGQHRVRRVPNEASLQRDHLRKRPSPQRMRLRQRGPAIAARRVAAGACCAWREPPLRGR